MIHRFIKNIQEENLFSKKDKLIVAISGGLDSVALASLLFHSGHNISFAHCNFNLRGTESEQDEDFVKNLSNNFNVTCHVRSFDTYKYAAENKISIQMAARDLRYEWFQTLRNKTGSKYIVVAHHKDDDIETFFINLIRGSGIRGFLGMKSKRNNIVRPLLSFRKKEMESYLHSIDQPFREDMSNTNTKYLRNNIRKNVIPLLQQMNPSFHQTFTNEVCYLNDVFKIYHREITAVQKEIVIMQKEGIVIIKEKLLNHKDREIILREILHPYGFNQIKRIIDSCQSSPGKMFFSEEYKLLIDRKKIIIAKKENTDRLNSFIVQKDSRKIECPLKIKFSLTEDMIVNTDKHIAFLDNDRLNFPLIIRKWKEGDFFYPIGMSGKKKLSDFFIDNKLSLFDKEDCWLLCSGDDIVWIIGHRIDDRFKVSEDTKKAYIAELF